MSDQLHIRTATPSDAEPLAALVERTFRDTFAADNSTEDMDMYVRDAFSLDRIRAEWADDANTFLLAFTNGAEQPNRVRQTPDRNDRPERDRGGPGRTPADLRGPERHRTRDRNRAHAGEP